MNAKTRTVMTLVALVLTFCLVSLEQIALAQSPRGFLGPRGSSARSTSAQSAKSNCRKLKGTSVAVLDPATGIASGPITHAGILNGPADDVINFSAGFVLTPDPNVITYLSDLTITTRRGQLRSSNNVNAFNFVTGTFTEFGNINPNTSTGSFAGAAGVIFFSGRTIGSLETGPYEAEMTGEICFAHDTDANDSDSDGEDDDDDR